MKLRDYALMGLVYCLPRRGLSRLVRRVAQSTTLGTPVIKLFCTLYAINIAEAEETNIRAYPTFGAFFTRALKPGARPLGKKGVVSPADGCVSQCGAIEDNTIIQAKGQQVDVTQLLAGDAAYAKQFQNGTFITIYLSPRDYHRVHMPCDATQSASAYIPGSLFPVNTASAGLVPNLYARNERLLARFDTELGEMCMIMVGAMLVSGIETVGAEKFVKGDEFGRFNYGSTVILLFSKPLELAVSAGEVVKMGQNIG
jgi:phosphatidylserine decarboxylase